MSRPATEIQLSTEEKETLLHWMRSTKTERRMVERARVILLAANGLNGKEIAARMETRPARVSKWLRRFAKDRIAGLRLNPPENALVLCVDEKPCIQALERAQGWIRLPNGRALTGFAHEYKRHGTTTLFASLNVASGLVHAGHYRRRRRREFLDFMNELVANILAKSCTWFWTILTPISRKRTAGSKPIPMCIFTLFPPTAAGSIRLNAGLAS